MKNNNPIYEELLDYCRWGWAEKLHETLESVQEPIDIFFNDNVLLRVAICDKDHPSMFIDIIKYYEDKIINHAANELWKSFAVMKLAHTLEEEIDIPSSLPPEIQDIKNKYKIDEDTEYLHDLDNEDEIQLNGNSQSTMESSYLQEVH